MTKKQAQRAGKALKKKMRTAGWKVRVWENLGWHYEVRNGYLAVWPTSERSLEYMTTLSTELGAAGTPAFWHVGKSFKDPNKAVAKQLNRAQLFVAGLERILKQQVKLLGG